MGPKMAWLPKRQKHVANIFKSLLQVNPLDCSDEASTFTILSPPFTCNVLDTSEWKLATSCIQELSASTKRDTTQDDDDGERQLSVMLCGGKDVGELKFRF